MLRTTISKIKQVCALTFVPRLLRADIRYIPGRYEKLSLCVQRRNEKSTNSSQKDEDECERCQRIIDRAFTPNPPHPDIIEMNNKHREHFMTMVTPQIPNKPESQCEKCQRIINEIFGEENAGDRKKDSVDPVCIPLTELQATTAKENAETLAQKIEKIDETPLVEANAKTTIEGFHMHPKVLGHRKKRQSRARVTVLNYSTDKSFHRCRKGSDKKDGSLDELAKRCLDSPSGQIDERLLKEIEKLGVPPPSRKGSRRTSNNAGILQPEIMRRPRRPVDKIDLDFLTMKKGRDFKSMNNDLSPPFELIPIKANSINLDYSYDPEQTTLHMERIQPYHLKDLLLMKGDPEIENIESLMDFKSYHEERLPQRLLGHMTATVMSGESDTMSDKSNEIEHLVVTRGMLEPVDLDQNRQLTRDRFKEEISLLKLKELEEQEENKMKTEKLTCTNLLSELVDPKEISPQSLEIIRENQEIETLRNLLQTRIDHLTPEKVKRIFPKDEPFVMAKDATANNKQATMTEFAESQAVDTLNLLAVKNLKLERIQPHHLKDGFDIISKETSSFTQPGTMIGESTKVEPVEETATHTTLRSFSQKRQMVTPHQLFEELSIISRETEIGVIMDDFCDFEGMTSNNSAAGKLIDNVGIISKDNSPTYEPKIYMSGIEVHRNKKTDLNKKSSQNHGAEGYSSYTFEGTTIVEEQDGKYKPSDAECRAFSSSETRPLGLNENDDPVVASEMGRFEKAEQYHTIEPNFLITPRREPILPQHEYQKPKASSVTHETILNPLFDKGAVAHISGQNNDSNISLTNLEMASVNLPNKHGDQQLPLSEMLKRVRRRNFMELCKEFELRMTAPEVDPLVGKCGQKKPPCPPPAPKCPPSTPTCPPKPTCPPPKPICPPPPPEPCPPPKPPCPDPCKPKCPPTCPPSPCAPKTKCPPPKKSPCDKFKKSKCSSIKIQDALTLLLYLGPQFHIPQKSLFPLIACTLNLNLRIPDAPSKLVTEHVLTSLNNLCSLLLISNLRGEINAMELAVAGKDSTDYARTYDPWTPIPSWPLTIKEERKKVVCPKEGCKVTPPKLNAPCRDINPCINFPKKHFSIIEFFKLTLGSNS